MQRFFVNYIDTKNDVFQLDDKDIIHQLRKVLRAKNSDEIILFNGKDEVDFLYKIELIGKKEVELKLLKRIEKPKTKTPNLHLYQAMPNKLQKIEYIIQKGVEVGYTSFNFFKSERSQKLNLSESKIKRLEKIIIEATEQSNRNKIPELIIKKEKDSLFIKNGENLFFHTQDKDSKLLKDFNFKSNNHVNLFVGPEGGWSDTEIKGFQKKGFTKAYLGNGILRTETVSSVVGFWVANN